MRSMRIACVQVDAGADWNKNLERLKILLKKALQIKPGLIALPENFCGRVSSKDLPAAAREVTPQALEYFKKLAATRRVYVLLGSVLEPAGKKIYNTSILISPQGKVAAKYRKIHLFDIALKNVKVTESRHIARGRKIVTAKVNSVSAGLTICYDLRFPELFRSLSARGAKVLFVPSNFTEKTGEAHWEVLLRARAIENQAFVVAPAQTGKHPENGVRSFGNSLIIDPWGTVLARGSRSKEEVVWADLHFASQAKLRHSFPVLSHRVL